MPPNAVVGAIALVVRCCGAVTLEEAVDASTAFVTVPTVVSAEVASVLERLVTTAVISADVVVGAVGCAVVVAVTGIFVMVVAKVVGFVVGGDVVAAGVGNEEPVVTGFGQSPSSQSKAAQLK